MPTNCPYKKRRSVMRLADVKNIKAGESLFVSYKGIRPCKFKNSRGNVAFVEFDSGDGTGNRLHRVLATTLMLEQPPVFLAAPTKAEPVDATFELLRQLADRLGYELIAK